jgi:hypothetical protein
MSRYSFDCSDEDDEGWYYEEYLNSEQYKIDQEDEARQQLLDQSYEKFLEEEKSMFLDAIEYSLSGKTGVNMSRSYCYYVLSILNEYIIWLSDQEILNNEIDSYIKLKNNIIEFLNDKLDIYFEYEEVLLIAKIV